MPVSASEVIALSLSYAKETLAASAAFRALVGASSVAEAKLKIFEGESDEHDGAQTAPRAFLDHGTLNSEHVSTTGWFYTGQIELVLELPIREAYLENLRDARRDFMNQAGKILSEMQALVGQGGYLNITQIEHVTSGRADPSENNDEQFYVGVWNLHWEG